MGVATGCGFKEIYRFPHTTYPYSSCICTFLQQHPYFFVHLKKVFSIHIPCMNLDVASKGTRTSASLRGNCIVHNIAGAELCTITPLVPVQLAVS